jgi:hypothetical protein
VNVRLDLAEFEQAAYVGFRRGMVAATGGLGDDEGRARPHFGPHIDGAVGELVVAKLLNVHWPAHLRVNRELGDLSLSGVKIEVRHRHELKRERDGLFAHRSDPDEHFGVLVTGRYPLFDVVGGFPLGEAKHQRFWNDKLPRPAFEVPAGELRSIEWMLL